MVKNSSRPKKYTDTLSIVTRQKYVRGTVVVIVADFSEFQAVHVPSELIHIF